MRPYLRPPNLKSVYISSIGLLLVFLRKKIITIRQTFFV